MFLDSCIDVFAQARSHSVHVVGLLWTCDNVQNACTPATRRCCSSYARAPSFASADGDARDMHPF